MAILPPRNYPDDWSTPLSTPTVCEVVFGKQVGVDYTIREAITPISHDEIKRRLAHEIAGALIGKNLIEFTKLQDPKSYGTIYRARLIVMPREKVEFMRKEKLIP
jgi:hypothetical protein